MADYTVNEVLARLDGYLDRVAEQARTHMQSYIATHANKGYQTGALASSIDVQPVGADTRSVGTSLRSRSGWVYGAFVDQGRGAITKTDGYLRYYDPKIGRWVRTKHVDKMDGIGFLQDTIRYLESTHIPL